MTVTVSTRCKPVLYSTVLFSWIKPLIGLWTLMWMMALLVVMALVTKGVKLAKKIR